MRHADPDMPPNAAPRGFTLVELMIVITILALLIGLTLPSLGRAREASRRVVCRANLHALAVAFRMYLNDSDNVMPVAADLPSAHLNDDPRICDVLAPDLPGPGVLRCPSDTVDKYYLSEGSSYEYHSLLGGRKVDDNFLTRHFGEDNTPVMNDYKPFHGQAGQTGAMNFLFADGHVGDFDQELP